MSFTIQEEYENWCRPRMSKMEPDHPLDAFEAGWKAAESNTSDKELFDAQLIEKLKDRVKELEEGIVSNIKLFKDGNGFSGIANLKALLPKELTDERKP